MDNENSSPIFQHGRDNFEDHYGIIFSCEQKEYKEFFFFSLSEKYIAMWHFLINNLKLLEHFSIYFREETVALLKFCDPHRIRLPSLEEIQIYTSIFHSETSYSKKCKKFLQEIHGTYLFDPEKLTSTMKIDESLTAREKECLQLLITEKTNKNIAYCMNISVRTVETHLENIRQKWQCANKTELILKVIDFYKLI